MDYHLLRDVEAEDELKRREERHMEIALQRSLEESTAGPSSNRRGVSGVSNPEERDLESLDEEMESVQAQITTLQSLLQTLSAQREDKLREIRDAQSTTGRNNAKGRAKAGDIDYTSDFEWSGALLGKLKSVFGFDSFRLCQKGICNANMDGRDIVAIMPTGGGKSLGYQLPALLAPGCTLVISPLLALISDQIMHLHEAGVDAVMLTGTTSKDETDRIYKRLQAMASGVSNTPDIKLCYVTPEKIANSKKFKTALDKLYRVKKLARFVIDEAHCVSSQGHDFRPDYQRLSALRQKYCEVPILALSATCPAAVLIDLLNTLRMPAITTASAATPEGTVIFTSSLYRKNLHYSVLPKPSDTNGSIARMRDYILQNHMNDTGIVYCLSKKDAESVAGALAASSGGAIKTGVYHADVGDGYKEILHRQWREGKVKVVCATIAFGLGIDKGDVRFVIHHSLSKTLDGFYQESGRAGRDGNDADCVLYYRPQDVFRIASMACDERDGQDKVRAMAAFASDLEQCRKILFANYFNKSSKLALSSWATDKEDALTPCGHCDNCTRPPEALERLDVATRVAAWKVLRIAQAAGREVTMSQLCDLARGTASRSGGRGKGKGRAKEDVVDVDRVAGGKVELSREHTETLCIRLFIDGYLKLSYQHTVHNVNVYLQPSDLAGRFTRFAHKADIEQGKGPPYDCVFLAKVPAKRKSGGAAAKAPAPRGKRKREVDISITDEDEDEDEDEEGEGIASFVVNESESDSDERDDWETSMRGGSRRKAPAQAQPRTKRPRNSIGGTPRSAQVVSSSSRTPPDVIDISSD